MTIAREVDAKYALDQTSYTPVGQVCALRHPAEPAIALKKGRPVSVHTRGIRHIDACSLCGSNTRPLDQMVTFDLSLRLSQLS